VRTPANADQFRPLIIRTGDSEWQVETAPRNGNGKAKATRDDFVSGEYLKAYDRLAT
jgi:hypothetical protein